MSLLYGIITGVLATLPLFIARKPIGAIVTGIVTAIVSFLIYWAAQPSWVWPLFGLYGFMVFAAWVISSIVAAIESEEFHHGWWLPIGMFCVYLITGVSGCNMFRAGDYARMIGQVEERIWTQDVQPKDPRHIRLVPENLAEFLADKQLGEVGKAIGSQFHVSKNHRTLQMIRGELKYVAPLDFNRFSAWTSAGVSPGYVVVSAEDPSAPAEVVTGRHFRYMPGAFFGDNLERFLWNNGYSSQGLTDYSFEIDEDGHPWWVVTVFKPTIVWWGEKVQGVVILDPETGQTSYYALGQIPNWVDRAVPREFVRSYIDDWGKYSLGWWNTIWGKQGIVESEEPTINYGSDGDPYWVTTLTSSNSRDQSLVGLIYTDTRTGKSVEYHAVGGTERAILQAVNNKVAYKNWRGEGPVLYNIHGTMASIVPLLGQSNTFQGVAIVNVSNLEVVEGNDQYAAYREYQVHVRSSGQNIAADLNYELSKLTGQIDRIGSETRGSNTIFYLHLVGTDRLFEGNGEVSPLIPVSKEGDQVAIEFLDAPGVVPLQVFKNLSLPLSISSADSSLQSNVGQRRENIVAHDENRTVESEINQMSPQELKELLKLKKQQAGH